MDIKGGGLGGRVVGGVAMAGIPFTPVQNGDRTPYGGGGGKLRTRRVTKRNATPYERPAVGRHASAGPQAAALMNGVGAAEGTGRGAWLGAGLLGTASKMVTSGASYLYSSFFRRRDVPLLLTEAERTPGVSSCSNFPRFLVAEWRRSSLRRWCFGEV